MAKLTEEQRQFITKHQIPLSKIFDASSMARREYGTVMGDLGKVVAIGVNPCEAHGHTMRTRHGHCIQCNPAALAFLRRFDEYGRVYVAHSKQIGLVKIGTASDVKRRISTLNNFGYGGANDWCAIRDFACDAAGRVEFTIQRALSQYFVIRSYVKNGITVECQELFTCDLAVAIGELQTAIDRKNSVTSHLKAAKSTGCATTPPKAPPPKAPPNSIFVNAPMTPARLANAMNLPIHKIIASIVRLRIIVAPDGKIERKIASKISREFGFILLKKQWPGC
jgi:hypothetical protein